MTDFTNGISTITEGVMISDFNGYECVISSELATLNEVSVGDTITLKNPNTEVTYDFTVTGIYTTNSDNGDIASMYSQSANKIITGSGVIDLLVADDSTLITTVTPSFILNSEEDIEAFTAEVKEKGLNEYYTINTNIDEIESATKSIENVKTFATTFLIITLVISSLVLFVINMINIRERKYEIGVFRTIGMSKLKLTIQFILELLIIATISLIIGAIIGGFLSKTVGNMLLASEIESSQGEQEEISNNFGKNDMNMQFNMREQVQAIESMEAVVDFKVVIQLLGIGILLTLISSLASMISIQRFSPLTILKERS